MNVYVYSRDVVTNNTSYFKRIIPLRKLKKFNGQRKIYAKSYFISRYQTDILDKLKAKIKTTATFGTFSSRRKIGGVYQKKQQQFYFFFPWTCIFTHQTELQTFEPTNFNLIVLVVTLENSPVDLFTSWNSPIKVTQEE